MVLHTFNICNTKTKKKKKILSSLLIIYCSYACPVKVFEDVK